MHDREPIVPSLTNCEVHNAKYSGSNFKVKYCFRFSPSVFRAFESVKLHELSSRSSYGNIRRPALDQSDFNMASLAPISIKLQNGAVTSANGWL